jgi:hypothetical protein
MGHQGTAILPLMGIKDRLRVLDNIITDASGKTIATTRSLTDGKMALRVWLIQMRDILVQSLAAGTMALAGREELSEPEKTAWVSETNLQYGYLVQWFRQIKEGSQQFNQAMVGRPDLYARAIWAVAWRVWVAGKIADDSHGELKPYGKRSLGISEHCGDCIDWAQLPWLPLEEVPPIGTSECGSRCHCTIEVEWR